MDTRIAWHFLLSDWTTALGELQVRPGVTLNHTGPLVLCRSGLHASTRAVDALNYAPGPVVTLVECEGEVIDGNDKFVCRRRTALWGYDATDELRTFARIVALEVLPLWPDAPDIVGEFLETGDETLLSAIKCAAVLGGATANEAQNAARTAVLNATWYAPEDAARFVSLSAARAASNEVDAAFDAALSRHNEILESLLIDGALVRGLAGKEEPQ